MVKEKEKTTHDANSVILKDKTLILLNDEFNAFDYVIETLVEVCSFNEQQAEQCTLIAHLKGKCALKKGSREELSPLKQQLADRKLSSVISE